MAVKIRHFFLVLGDIILLYFSLTLTLFLGFWGNFSREIFLQHLPPFSVLYFFWLIIFFVCGLYELNSIKSPSSFYLRLFWGLTICLGISITFFYLIPFFGITPKTNLVLHLFIFGTLITIFRKFFYTLFSTHFLNRTAILGSGILAENLAKEIISRPHLGYKLNIFFKTGEEVLDFSFPGVKNLSFKPVVKEKNDFFSKIQEEKINTLIISEDLKSDYQFLEELYRCFPTGVKILTLSGTYEKICGKIPPFFINQTRFLENLQGGEKSFYEKIKRFTDIILAGFLLVLTFPFCLFIVLVIKLDDRGPVFYFQERIGKDGKPFLLIKFRSMKTDAEKRRALWADREDSRVSGVGKILRRIHFDEIPQMINVLKGDISLVGPRPERPEFVNQLEKEIPYYHFRHLIKPGFSGWAQIKFRYARSIIDSQEKFQYDLYYLKNRSFILDLTVLFKTFQLFFKKE